MSLEKYSKILKELSEVEELSKEKLREFPKVDEEGVSKELSFTVEELREMLLGELREEAEKLRQESFEKGYSEGKEEGLKIFLEEVERIKILFAELRQKIEGEVQKFIDSLTPQVVNLSLKIASKVISGYVEIDKELVTRLIREVLTEISEIENIKVEVNPVDLEIAKKFLDEVLRENSYLKVELEPNPQVSKGGCVVETPTKYIDNQIDMRLNILEEEIKRKLLDERGYS